MHEPHHHPHVTYLAHVPDAYQKRTQTLRPGQPPRAVICGVTSSGEIVENMNDDVAGDGSNDMPDVVLAHASPGFPARC
jgi:hypothetical protein